MLLKDATEQGDTGFKLQVTWARHTYASCNNVHTGLLEYFFIIFNSKKLIETINKKKIRDHAT